jgi:hypothetical protein
MLLLLLLLLLLIHSSQFQSRQRVRVLPPQARVLGSPRGQQATGATRSAQPRFDTLTFFLQEARRALAKERAGKSAERAQV